MSARLDADGAGLRVGVSSGESSKAAARKLAASKCTEGGGSGMKLLSIIKNGCIATAGSAKANKSSVIRLIPPCGSLASVRVDRR
ncbi:DUF4189 domain-containing protein [Xanthomonas arboricola]